MQLLRPKKAKVVGIGSGSDDLLLLLHGVAGVEVAVITVTSGFDPMRREMKSRVNGWVGGYAPEGY